MEKRRIERFYHGNRLAARLVIRLTVPMDSFYESTLGGLKSNAGSLKLTPLHVSARSDGLGHGVNPNGDLSFRRSS